MILHNNKAMPINLHDEDCEIHKKCFNNHFYENHFEASLMFWF